MQLLSNRVHVNPDDTAMHVEAYYDAGTGEVTF